MLWHSRNVQSKLENFMNYKGKICGDSTLSYILESKDSTLIGRKSSVLELPPFLKIGMTYASYRVLGKVLVQIAL